MSVLNLVPAPQRLPLSAEQLEMKCAAVIEENSTLKVANRLMQAACNEQRREINALREERDDLSNSVVTVMGYVRTPESLTMAGDSWVLCSACGDPDCRDGHPASDAELRAEYESEGRDE